MARRPAGGSKKPIRRINGVLSNTYGGEEVMRYESRPVPQKQEEEEYEPPQRPKRQIMSREEMDRLERDRIAKARGIEPEKPRRQASPSRSGTTKPTPRKPIVTEKKPDDIMSGFDKQFVGPQRPNKAVEDYNRRKREFATANARNQNLPGSVGSKTGGRQKPGSTGKATGSTQEYKGIGPREPIGPRVPKKKAEWQGPRPQIGPTMEDMGEGYRKKKENFRMKNPKDKNKSRSKSKIQAMVDALFAPIAGSYKTSRRRA